jgi:hypothetical protein
LTTPEDDPISEGGFEIANEFARVIVRRRNTRNGMRLEIASPRLKSGIMLDAVVLESLTWQTPETLSRFLSTPFQPADATPVEEEEEEGTA